MTATTTTQLGAASVAAPPGDNDTLLPLTVRLRDGREVTTERTAERHRQLHLSFLHSASRGYVEVAAGRREQGGKVDIYTRRSRDHFVPGGGYGDDANWHLAALALADSHLDAGEELFLGVAPRALPSGNKSAVQFSQWLWMDVDGAGHLDRLQALLERKPAHLLIESGGSGGMHAYWRLADRLPARQIRLPDGRIVVNPLEVREPTGEKGRTRLVGWRELATREVITVASKVDSIERGNLRLLHALGARTRGGLEVPVGDVKCREQSRVLRWAGSRHGRTGNFARIVRLDLWLPPYRPGVLVGDLPDPPTAIPVKRRDLAKISYDAYRLIPASAYFPRIAGVDVPERGNMSCPSPLHEDIEPSCSVEGTVFFCHGCEAQGTYIDLWSLMNGGPTGDALAQDRAAFQQAVKGAQDALRGLV